jgi:hypothetical protein
MQSGFKLPFQPAALTMRLLPRRFAYSRMQQIVDFAGFL